MADYKEIVIPGQPIAKKRPRFARRGKHVMAYNDQETEEGKVALLMKDQWRKEPTPHAVSMTMHFYFQRPKYHFGTGRNADKLKTSAPSRHLQKPDIDNCIKSVMDCAKNILWIDDAQVVLVKAQKHWCYGDNQPQTVMYVEVLT